MLNIYFSFLDLIAFFLFSLHFIYPNLTTTKMKMFQILIPQPVWFILILHFLLRTLLCEMACHHLDIDWNVFHSSRFKSTFSSTLSYHQSIALNLPLRTALLSVSFAHCIACKCHRCPVFKQNSINIPPKKATYLYGLTFLERFIFKARELFSCTLG